MYSDGHVFRFVTAKRFPAVTGVRETEPLLQSTVTCVPQSILAATFSVS